LAFAEPQPAVAVASSLQRQRYEDFSSCANFSSKIHLFRGVFFALFLQKNPVGVGRAKVSDCYEQTGWFATTIDSHLLFYYDITLLLYYFLMFFNCAEKFS
jgi:hypothetical protein